MSIKAWHISYLSAIVGPCAATTNDGCMAWSNDESDFVMRLLDRENKGTDLMLVIQPEMDEITIYTLSGYCAANNLKYLIKDWDELASQKDEENDETRH